MSGNNDLEYHTATDVSLAFSLANAPASATTALTLPQGGVFLVPQGNSAHPVLISGTSNAPLSAGSAQIVVQTSADNGTTWTPVPNGPTVTLNTSTQRAAATLRVGGALAIRAGWLVRLVVVTDAAYAPVTADLDALLLLKLVPA